MPVGTVEGRDHRFSALRRPRRCPVGWQCEIERAGCAAGRIPPEPVGMPDTGAKHRDLAMDQSGGAIDGRDRYRPPVGRGQRHAGLAIGQKIEGLAQLSLQNRKVTPAVGATIRNLRPGPTVRKGTRLVLAGSCR
jgi:hypothetical protein